MFWAKMGVETDTTHVRGAQRVAVCLARKTEKAGVEMSTSQEVKKRIQSLQRTNHTHIYTAHLLACRPGNILYRVVH